MEILITPDGNIRHIYSDELTGVFTEDGTVNTFRASHVEPAKNEGWTADMAPMGGPVLSGFKLRQEALDAETRWITNYLTGRSNDD